MSTQQAGTTTSVQPLGQTFKVSTIGGSFLTAVDLFFAFKDPNIPIWCEIRNVVDLTFRTKEFFLIVEKF